MQTIGSTEKRLIEHFKDKEVFSRDELLAFYRSYEPDLNEGTFGWRIYELKRKHIIKGIKKGVYTLEQKHSFNPEIDKTIQKIGKILESSFDYHFYNIWNTTWLNEWSELQATFSMIILEVDRDSTERVFYNLKDRHSIQQIFLKPDEGVMNTYVSELSQSLIIKPMISRAPTFKIKNVILPTLEKILVDLYCDEKLFFAFQGNQLVKIYQSCFEKYIINLSRMFNYARRRKREEGIKVFLLENLEDKIKEVIE
jgi:hypothetical protein